MGLQVTDLINGNTTIYNDAEDFLFSIDNEEQQELEEFFATFELTQTRTATFQNFYIEKLQSELIY